MMSPTDNAKIEAKNITGLLHVMVNSIAAFSFMLFATTFITIHCVVACDDCVPLSMNSSLVAPPFVHMAALTSHKVMVTATPKAGATLAVQIVLDVTDKWEAARKHASLVPGLDMSSP